MEANKVTNLDQQAIQKAAYRLWEEAGKPEEDPLRFWLAAEQEFSCHGDMTAEDAELGKGPDRAEPAPKRESVAATTARQTVRSAS